MSHEMESLLKRKYEMMRELAETLDVPVRKLFQSLDYNSEQILRVEREHTDATMWKPTREGYSVLRNVQRIRPNRDYLAHSVPAILAYLKEQPMTVVELQKRIELPKCDLIHIISILAGEDHGFCPYKVRGYSCFIQNPPWITRVSLIGT